MRADEGADVALDALGHIPFGNVDCCTALLILGGASRPCAVFQTIFHHGADGQLVAFLTVHRDDDILDEVRNILLRCIVFQGRPACRDLDLDEFVDTVIDGSVVLRNDFGTLLLEVGLVDRILHFLDRLVDRNDVSQFEEGCLQDGVGAVAQTDVTGDIDRVDDVEVSLLLSQCALHAVGQLRLEFFGAPLAVEEEGAAFLQGSDHVVLVDVARVVAGNEVSRLNEVRCTDRIRSETQMGLGQAAGLLGVVDEVCLAVHICRITDDLDGVLVRTDGTIGTHAPELSAALTCGSGVGLFCGRKGRVGDFVDDTDGEVRLGLVSLEVVKDCDDLARGGVLGGQTVAAANDIHRQIFRSVDGDDVLIEGLTQGTGFLGSVENSDLLAGRRDSCQEVIRGERSVQMDVDHADFLAAADQQIDRFFGGLCSGAHQYDDSLSIFSTIVIEEFVVSAGELVDLAHVLFDDGGDFFKLGVAGLAALEEDVGVDGGTSCRRVFRVEGVLSECFQRFHVHQRAQVFIIERFDLLDLVAGTETVEEVQERHACIDRGQMCDSTHVHDFLRRRRREQGEAGASDAHDVTVVTEDGQRVRRQRSCGDVEDTGEHLAGDFVHVGDHEEQTLGSGVGGGQSTGLKRPVNCTGSAAFGLHLDDLYGLTEQVLFAVRCPLIHMFCHGRRGSDREDAGNFGECIRNICSRFITVHDCKVLRHV